MKIASTTISNYRNIDDVTIITNPKCNYIIGENNLGKSNLISLLEAVCSGKSFADDDYADPEQPIIVEMTINLLAEEEGFFGDNFAPEDATVLHVRYQQAIEDAFPTVISSDTNESIQPKQLRKLGFIKYESTSSPSKELRLDTQKGAGLLIRGIIERNLADEVPSFLDDEQVGDIIGSINDQLCKIRSFHDYSIKATVSPDPVEMLTRLLYLSDGDRKIDAVGSGVQYIAMASISVLGQIMEFYKNKSIPFEGRLYTDGEGKKLLPLILSVDEPEVHLHPFLQRSLINYYKRILSNLDSEFVELLKSCFDIDGLDGQLIVVTHSTDALVGDHRNLVRFHKKDGQTATVSGSDSALDFGTADEKHLAMRFPEIKEAFYSKCAVLVEGETEFGCIHAFAETINIHLDDYCISAINARGEQSIKPLRQLLGTFAIPSVAIYDGDVSGRAPSPEEFFTIELCFEFEIVKTLFDRSDCAMIRQIAKALKPNAETVSLQEDYIKKAYGKRGISLAGYTPKKLSDVVDGTTEFLDLYSAWFFANKGILLGRIVGDMLSAEQIPQCYKDVIAKAKEVSLNA